MDGANLRLKSDVNKRQAGRADPVDTGAPCADDSARAHGSADGGRGVAAPCPGTYRSPASRPPPVLSPHYAKRMPSGSKSVITGHASPSPRTAPALTDLEHRILEYMVHYLRAHTYQPSIREIGHHFGIKSTKTVSELLQSLADKGVVERDPARSRAIRILGLDLNARTVSLPCFRDLAEAVAGLRSGGAEQRVCLDRRLANRNGGFMIHAPGDRLASAGIGKGDLLLVQPVHADELRDGEIVVARARGVTDYYQLEKRGSQVLLRVAGGDGRAVDGVQPVILGRVAGLYRHVTPLSFAGPLTAH